MLMTKQLSMIFFILFFSIIDRSRTVLVDVIVKNNNINFEIDTGSRHSVMSKKLYSRFSHIKLQKNNISPT